MTGPSPAPTATEDLATRRDWIGLYVLSIACLIYAMDMSVLFLATPAIVVDLQPTAAEILWINDIYGFMIAGFLVTMGAIGDRIGRRKILLIGIAAFGAASILAAFSTTPAMLIFARALLGIAGATIAPSTLSLIISMFRNERQKSQAIGIWGMVFSLGGLVGPIIGGVLLQFFHWGSVFLINVPIMLAMLATAPFLLPEYKNPQAHRLDLISVGLSLASVLPVIYGIKEIAEIGLGWISVATIVAGLVIGFIFVQRQKVLADPMVDLALFSVPPFVVSLLVNLFGVFFIMGIYLYQNQYLQLVLKLSPLEAGLWSVLPSIVFTLMSLFAYRVTTRIGATRSVVLGLWINAVGALLMGLAGLYQSLPGILVSSMIIGIGFVPVILTTTELIVGSAPLERAGSASAIGETGSELGGALGVALLGSLATWVYRSLMLGAETYQLPDAAAKAVHSSLGSAVEQAAKLGLQDPSWLTYARLAFADAYATICFSAAVFLVVLAMIAHRVYHHSPR